MNLKTILSAIALMAVAAQGVAEDAAEEQKHWSKTGNASLQFTQGFVSKNWYKGGESNFALLGTADYVFNYTNGKFTWDNHLEGKLGFISTPSDEFHKYMANQDILKYTTKLGYAAGHNWFYTVQALGQTQFTPGYKSNDDNMYSKFFSPAYFNLSVGMDWKKETEKITWTVYISPLAYNLVFVADPLRDFYTNNQVGENFGKQMPGAGRIDGTQFGLKEGDFNLYDLGATAKAGMVWKVSKYLTWSSQATYFSPLYKMGKYKDNVYTRFEWENTFDMPLNKYFSTKLFTHLRFDDSVGPQNKAKGWNYFQFTELLSFGLSYNW